MADEEEEKKEGEEAAAGEGGEGAEGEGAEGGEGKKGLDPKKLVLFIGVPILILVGVGAGLYFSGFLDPYLGKGEEHVEGEDGEHAEDAHGEEHGDKKKKKEEHAKGGGGGGGHGGGHGEGGGSNFLEIPPMIVNLNSPDGNPRYLRLTVQLELEDPADGPAVQAVIPRVVDQFQTYLRELRVKDLRGSAGIYRLQMELLWRVNQAAAPVKIKDVLFQEILIQ